MATDIRIDDDFVTIEGPLKVNEVRPRSVEEVNFPNPIKVDQIRPRSQKSILFISEGIKLLRSGEFDPTVGTALAHGAGDKLVINEGGSYKGGVAIEGHLAADSLAAKQFVQTADLSAKAITTDTLSAKKVTADSLTTKLFVQTVDLGAKTVQTKSADVAGDLVIGGKIVAASHGSVDLVELILQLKVQVADLQKQVDALKNK